MHTLLTPVLSSQWDRTWQRTTSHETTLLDMNYLSRKQMVTNPVMNLYVLTSESWFPLAMKSCSAFNTCEVEYHKWGVKTESDSFVSRILLFFKICMMGFWNVRLNIAWGIGIELGSTSGNATITSLFLSCLHNHNHNHKRTRKTWIYIRKFMVFGKLFWFTYLATICAIIQCPVQYFPGILH